ncbi:MAG: hypothetical protein NZ874_07725 [Fimbriimonadales bacterium]|nr:hypothetical protein [Fimbriimonadales bacterium]
MRSSHTLWILLVGSTAYLPRVGAPFVADDHFIFTCLQQGGAFGFASQPPTRFFRPLISLQYYADYILWGLNPLLSHLVNLAWHLACAILVYLFACRLLQRWGWERRDAEYAALWGALMFTGLPANVEAVAWFAARADMVATAGALGTLLLLERFLQQRRPLSYFGALFCFVGGLFCKESLLSFPFIVWLWLRFLGARGAGRLAAPFFGVLLLYVAMRTLAVGGLGAYPDAWTTLQRPWWLGVYAGAYLFQMGMPAILYGLGRDGWDTLLWGAWGLGIALLVLAARRRVQGKPLQMDWRLLSACVLLALLPVLIFKPSPLYFLNSRYSYLASAFAVVGVGALLGRFVQARPMAFTGTVILLLAYYAGTLRQADAWRVAGETVRRSIRSLRDAPAHQPLLILSIPDHFHGAYIWRAGLPEAIALLIPERAHQPIYVASRFTMRLRADVRVNYANGVATLSSAHDIFLLPEGTPVVQGDEPIVLRDKVVVHHSLIRRHALLGYEAGRFVPVAP